MKFFGTLLRLSLKTVLLSAMALIALIAIYAALGLLFPVALLLAMMIILRLCWRVLTPRPDCGYSGAKAR